MPDWEKFRRQFPVTGMCAYLDSAYDCGGSLIGRAAANRYFDDWVEAAASAKRGGPGREPFFAAADETREYIGRLLGGASARNVTLTKNTNEGFNIILQGFDFGPDDNVVTFDREHSSIIAPCVNASEAKGFKCRFARMDENFNPSIDELWSQVDEHTVMVLVSHVQSLSGCALDLRELGRRCRERGIFLAVDGIQSVGLMPFKAEEWGVSAVSCGGYKGLGAFISIGFLYCCDELLARIRPVYVSHGFNCSLDYSSGLPKLAIADALDASKLDNSSSDYLGAYVFHDSLRAILDIGVENIHRRVSALLGRLHNGLNALGYKLLTPADDGRRCASLCFGSTRSQDIFDYLMSKGVVTSCCSGGKYIRMSLGAYTSDEDIDRALSAAASCPWR